MSYQVARSETLPWTSGGIKNLPLDFMDRNGVRGMRWVCEKLVIKVILNTTTVAANTLVGADQAGFIKSLQVKDAAGPRIYLTGAELRVFAHAEQFDAVFADPATHGASTTQNDTYVHVIDFSQERTALRPYDCSIPVDDFSRGGQIIIEFPTNGDILQTGTGLTINSGTCVVTALLREETKTEFKARDQRESIDAVVASAAMVPGNGRLLRSAFVYKAAQGGGASLAGITDITIEPFKIISEDLLTLQTSYTTRAPLLNAQDPFAVVNTKAVALIFPRVQAKITDYLLVPGNIYFKSTTAVALPFRILTHWIAPKDARIAQITIDDRGVKGPVGVKTVGGDMQDSDAFGDYAAFMPMEAKG